MKTSIIILLIGTLFLAESTVQAARLRQQSSSKSVTYFCLKNRDRGKYLNAKSTTDVEKSSSCNADDDYWAIINTNQLYNKDSTRCLAISSSDVYQAYCFLDTTSISIEENGSYLRFYREVSGVKYYVKMRPKSKSYKLDVTAAYDEDRTDIQWYVQYV